MASFKVFLDVKSAEFNGKFPVKINLSHNHTGIRIDTGVLCCPQEWTGNDKRPLSEKNPYNKVDNDRIEEIVRSYDTAIYELKKNGRIKSMRPSDIRAYVDNKESVYTSQVDVISFAKVVRERKNKVTAGHVDDLIRWITNYIGERKTLAFEDIDRIWLDKFQQYLSTHSMQRSGKGTKWKISSKKGLSSTTQGIIMRNLKMIYNAAIADNQVSADCYPFRGYRMPKSRKRKDFLMPKDMRALRDAELDPHSRTGMARDYFMLIFYLCGVNLADIWRFESYDKNGYIEFVRKKTEQTADEEELIRMKIPQEAITIINRHRGKLFLLDAQDKYIQYESFYSAVFHGLDKLTKELGIQHVGTYTCRNTWSTYASHENVPEWVVDKSLGHSSKTIAFKNYVNYDWRKTDKANRIVINFLNSHRSWDDEVDW